MSLAPAQAAPPLDHPWYGIGFGAAVKRFFTKYATFSGRASRGEYWWAYLFYAIVVLVLYGITIAGLVASTTAASRTGGTPRFSAGMSVASGLLSLFFLGTIVPVLAVAVRRLHDTGRSGWNYLIGLIPLAGPIILIVFLAGETTPNAEQYGPPRSQYPVQGYGAPGPYGQAYPPV